MPIYRGASLFRYAQAMTLGLYLRSVRKKKKLSLTDLSKESGVTLESLSRFENSKRFPSIDSLQRITRSLGLDLLEVVNMFPEEVGGQGKGFNPSEIDPLTLAGTLKSKRIELGWTLEYAAQKSGISIGPVRRVENGENIWYAALYKLSVAYGLDYNELLSQFPGSIVTMGDSFEGGSFSYDVANNREDATFGDFLRRRRIEMGLTNESLAEIAGTSVFVIFNLLSNLSFPTDDVLRALAQELQFDPVEIRAKFLDNLGV